MTFFDWSKTRLANNVFFATPKTIYLSRVFESVKNILFFKVSQKFSKLYILQILTKLLLKKGKVLVITKQK